MSTVTITPQQILDDRAHRKNAGLTGCITGSPVPELSYPRDFFGYRDVQIWFRDANGNLNGDPGFDRKNPMCFCFDCRGAFDPRGEVDAELVNQGHTNALYTYRSLFPDLVVSNPAVPDGTQAVTADGSPPGGESSLPTDAASSSSAGATPGFSNSA